MAAPLSLHTVTLDGEAMALVQARDQHQAVQIGFTLFAVSWFYNEAANDAEPQPPGIAAAVHRERMAVRAPTDAERHLFATTAQKGPSGEVAMAGFLLESGWAMT